ncbi:hypothetical protein OS493_037944 [Desmophyllum pertusum]|uniref:Uncharacterized protein n=1 Tax=Desmophyllum pertusum TaxID=174260 RepID=A0A9W9ZHU4_9CNID|nr:hypothetical protein OS493_037944 [Desmophyllum pertusum]
MWAVKLNKEPCHSISTIVAHEMKDIEGKISSTSNTNTSDKNQVINVTKIPGPRGPPGYNGTQGLSGPSGVPGYNGSQGPPGSGKLSLCAYMTAASSGATTGVYTTQSIQKTELAVTAELEKLKNKVKENERKISYVGSSNSSIITQDQNATELWLAIRKLSIMNASVSEQLIDVQQEIVKLDQKVINISKTSGPRGPPGYNGTQGLPGTFGVPGYNGTQGLPGPPGSSVSGKLSLCSYMTAVSSGATPDAYASRSIQITESAGKKFLGVNCDSNDAKCVVMSSSESGGKRTYTCKCKGTKYDKDLAWDTKSSNASVNEKLIDVRQQILRLDQKVINISKVQLSKGLPGYNGTQGPPGPPGSPGSGKLSLCVYMTAASTATATGTYANQSVQKTESAGKKFLGVNCDSNDAKLVKISSTESGGKRTYKCTCKGTLSSGDSYMYCYIHYWECPT